MGFRYVTIVGEIFLAAVFLIGVVAGIRSWLWKVIWIVSAGSLWYFAGLFFAVPLIIGVIVQIAMTLESSARGVPAKDGVSTLS